MNKLSLYILLLLCSVFTADAITAEQVLANAANGFSKASGISASYTLKFQNGGSSNGSINVQGKKFRIETAQLMICYDGNNQWEYLAKSKQCTLTAPSYQETAQINPFAILNTYKSSYKAAMAKSSIKGTYAVRLTPVSSTSPISRATLYIKSSDWLPVRLDVLDKEGNLSTILIKEINLNAKFNDGTFTFDKKNYPGVELIDLR